MAPKAKAAAKAADQHEQHEEMPSKQGPKMPWGGEVVPTNAVSGRCYHISTLWDGKLLCVGGWDGKTKHIKDVATFDFATSSWGTLEVVGDPHPGTSQSAAAEVGGALLFFGGWDGMQRVNALTMLQLEDARWAPFPTVGEAPPPTTYHTCSVVGKRMYVYGGNTADGQQGEMRILDLNSTEWSTAMAHGAPGKRSSHTATVVHDSHLVIFGGRGGSDGSHCLNDVAVFDTTANQWVIGVKVEGAPSPRYGHSAVAIGNKVVVYGGCNEKGDMFDDVWVLDVEKPNVLVWSKIPASTSGPSPRTGHSALETMGGMYIVGGRTDNVAHTTSDIFHMDLSPVAPLPPTTGDEGGNLGDPSGPSRNDDGAGSATPPQQWD